MRSYTSQPRDVSFELDGVTFTPRNMSLMDLADLAKYGDLDVDSAEGLAALGGFFHDVLGEDYQRFNTHCAEHHTDAETMLRIIEDCLKDVLGFPTGPASDSSPGPASTGPTLRVVSSDGKWVERAISPEEEEELRAQAAG